MGISKVIEGRLPSLVNLSKHFREELLNVDVWVNEVKAGCKASGKRIAYVKPIVEVFPQEFIRNKCGKDISELVYVVILKCNLTGIIGVYINGVFQYMVRESDKDFLNRVSVRKIPTCKEALEIYNVLYYNLNLLKEF